jgi:peroxiredoxin
MNSSGSITGSSDGSFSAIVDLVGARLPPLILPSTDGKALDFTNLPPRCVLILYPFALAREQLLPPSWMGIPSSAACTEQLLDFKAHYGEFQARQVGLFGISTQSSIVQKAVVKELGLPFPLLSDAGYTFARALHLPMLHVGRRHRLACMVLMVRNCHIDQIFYPMMSPSRSAIEAFCEWKRDFII